MPTITYTVTRWAALFHEKNEEKLAQTLQDFQAHPEHIPPSVNAIEELQAMLFCHNKELLDLFLKTLQPTPEICRHALNAAIPRSPHRMYLIPMHALFERLPEYDYQRCLHLLEQGPAEELADFLQRLPPDTPATSTWWNDRMLPLLRAREITPMSPEYLAKIGLLFESLMRSRMDRYHLGNCWMTRALICVLAQGEGALQKRLQQCSFPIDENPFLFLHLVLLHDFDNDLSLLLSSPLIHVTSEIINALLCAAVVRQALKSLLILLKAPYTATGALDALTIALQRNELQSATRLLIHGKPLPLTPPQAKRLKEILDRFSDALGAEARTAAERWLEQPLKDDLSPAT